MCPASFEVINWPRQEMRFSYAFILFQVIFRKLDCWLYNFLKYYKSCMGKKKWVYKCTQHCLACQESRKTVVTWKHVTRVAPRRSHSHSYYPQVVTHLSHLEVNDLIIKALSRLPENGIQPLSKQVKFFVTLTFKKTAFPLNWTVFYSISIELSL